MGKMRLAPLPPLHICTVQQHPQKVRHVDESWASMGCVSSVFQTCQDMSGIATVRLS